MMEWFDQPGPAQTTKPKDIKGGAMFRGVIAIAIAALCSPATAGLTREEAQKLPVSELAGKVFGEAGTVMVDVDRPQWSGPFAEPGLPPVGLISFYQRPTQAYAGEDWQGLCQSLVFDVVFDQSGNVISVKTHTVYGVSGNMQRTTPNKITPSPSDAEARCAAKHPKTDFFAAIDLPQAQAAAIGLEQLRQSAELDPKTFMGFKCRNEFGMDCQSPLALSNIASEYINRGGWDIAFEECPSLRPKNQKQVGTPHCITLRRTNGCSTVSNLDIDYDATPNDIIVRRANAQTNRIVC